MGLLNFRKKNKKRDAITDSLPKLTFNNDIPDDTDSGISSEYHSPIADSFMMESSIFDFTSSSLLDEILNELPSSRKTQVSSSSGSEISSTRDILHSLNLKSNYCSNHKNSIADYYPRKGIIAVPADGSAIRILVKENTSKNIGTAFSTVNTHHISPYAKTAASIIVPNLLREPHPVYGNSSINNNAPSEESESDSSSFDSLSSTEEFVPLHPISWSDPYFHPAVTTCKQEDTVPLIELISRSYASSSGHSNNVTKSSFNGGIPSNANNATGLSNIQISSVFAINRMKERHRQEYRRSLQWTPSVVEQKAFPTRRANSLIANRSSNSTLIKPTQQQQQQQQQQHDMIAANQRVIVVPMINNIGSFNNSMSPKKTFSTNTSTNYRQYSTSIVSSEAHGRPLVMMKPIQENSSTSVERLKPAVPKVITPQAKKYHCRDASINKHLTTIINLKPESTTSSCCNNNQAISCSCYTHQSCHARHVTQTHHFSGYDPSSIQTKNYSQQKKIFQTANNNNKRAEIDCSQENVMAPKQRAADEEKAAKLDGVLEKRMKMTPKLKTEFRRMQQIYRKKYYSLPNLLQLLDHEEVKESPRRKSLENELGTQSKDIATVALNSSELSNEKKRLASAISKTKDNRIEEYYSQQHLHHNSKCRKVIYSCSHHRPHNKIQHRTHNHYQSCLQHQRQAETLCSRHTRERQQCCCSSSHKPRIQQQRKPLSVLTPSELSNTTMTTTVVAPLAGTKQQHTQQNFKTGNFHDSGKSNQQFQLLKSRCYSCHHSYIR